MGVRHKKQEGQEVRLPILVQPLMCSLPWTPLSIPRLWPWQPRGAGVPGLAGGATMAQRARPAAPQPPAPQASASPGSLLVSDQASPSPGRETPGPGAPPVPSRSWCSGRG